MLSPRHRHIGLACSRFILTSLGEGVSLALVSHCSIDGVTINIPFGICYRFFIYSSSFAHGLIRLVKTDSESLGQLNLT